MRLTTIRPSIRNILVTNLGLFICFMVIPSSSFADPFWSIGFSGGNGGINGFTLSIGDYGGIPVYIDQPGPPCGQPYDYYDDHPRQHWGRKYFHHEVLPQHMDRPNEYPRNDYRRDQYRQNMSRPNQHNQNYNRPSGYQQNGYRQNQYGRDLGRQNQNVQNMSRQSQHVQSLNRPDGYQQNGSIKNQQRQNIDRQKREKQHQWEMSMMN